MRVKVYTFSRFDIPVFSSNFSKLYSIGSCRHKPPYNFTATKHLKIFLETHTKKQAAHLLTLSMYTFLILYSRSCNFDVQEKGKNVCIPRSHSNRERGLEYCRFLTASLSLVCFTPVVLLCWVSYYFFGQTIVIHVWQKEQQLMVFGIRNDESL